MGVALFVKVTLAASIVAGASFANEIGDVEAGKQVFSQCKGCHQLGAGAKDRIGPHLNGIFGRRAGAHDGFKYSKSNRKS